VRELMTERRKCKDEMKGRAFFDVVTVASHDK